MQPRPQTTPVVFNDYDWTGLIYDFFVQVSNNYLHDDSHWFYDGVAYNQWGGNEFGAGSSWFYSFGDLNSYGSGYNRGGKIQVSGSSTYKWKWIPPDRVDTPGVPDYGNFPVPGTGISRTPTSIARIYPLFVLGRVQGSISAEADVAGTTADGQLLDEWTNATNPTLQQFSGLIPPTLSASTLSKPTHGITRATFDPVDAKNTTLMSLLSPKPLVEGYYVPNFNGYGPFEPYCTLQLGLETHAFAIELGDSKQPTTYADNGGDTTLDLFKYAQKRGDGGNQFVYNKAGNLFIPAAVNLNGAPGDVTPADTYYLAHYAAVQIVTDIGYTNPAFFNLKDTPTNIVPRTPVGNGINYDGLVYYGLPQNNADLGNHQVTLQVNTDPLNLKLASQIFQTSEYAHIQTFFKDNDVTHPSPSGTAYEIGLPNWFYYYIQIYQLLNPNLAPFLYEPAGDMHHSYYTPANDTIHIADTANRTNSIPVFALSPGDPFVSWIGDLTVTGLNGFITTAAHEQGHRNDSHGTGGNPPIEGTTFGGGDFDSDGDEISDNWERAHHFDATMPDTTGAYKGRDPNPAIDAGKGDREALCDIQALGVLSTYYSQKLFLQDWSTSGTQFGKLKWPAGQPQWTFTPRDKMNNWGTPTNVLPPNALYALP